MIKAELTPGGYAREMLRAINNKRQDVGIVIEMEIAQRKLDKLVNPLKTQRLEDPFIDQLKLSVDFTAPLFRYSKEDYEEALSKRPETGQSIDRIREDLKLEIDEDWARTNEAYQQLPYREDLDPFLLAGKSYERGFLAEALGLLGYDIEFIEEGRYKASAPQRIFTHGDIETVIENRINSGLRRLIYDYWGMYGEIRRPVLRQAITLAQEMARSLRGQ